MNYSGISECDVLNGTGFRTVLFVSGCDHKCHGCHNPETWDKNFGHPFTEETKEYILECLSKDYIDGITITGGDPLNENNLDDVLKLIEKIRLLFPEKHIWIYSGYTWENIFSKSNIVLNELTAKVNDDYEKRKQIISLCDVFIDGRYIDSQRNVSLKFRGSSNQRVIDIKKSLEQNKVVLYLD